MKNTSKNQLPRKFMFSALKGILANADTGVTLSQATVQEIAKTVFSGFKCLDELIAEYEQSQDNPQ